MFDEDRIGDLIVQWSEAAQQGRETPIDQLCADCPELAGEVSSRIRSIKAMEWLEDSEGDESDSDALPDVYAWAKSHEETRLPATSLTADEFSERLGRTGLVSVADVERVRQTLAQADALSLATSLIADELLTLYQARTVLLGNGNPLLLDQYEILDTIDQGGMGVVYLALHRSMDRVVALKTLPEEAVDSPDKVQRFQREVKALAKLQHANIVTTHDARFANGTHFLVMEYVSGKDLSKVVAVHGPLTVGKAVNFILQAARGLEHAHGRNVIHRDMKPGNLILDDEGRVKILDLGLARIEHPQAEQRMPRDGELTEAGSVMGTIDYMAPEQALDTRQADHRSDIYSLGCTMYFLLTGRTPFAGDTTMKTIMAHQQQPIPSLSKVRQDVPSLLDRVYQRMLAKDPGDRFQSVSELIAELEACQITDSTGPLALDIPFRQQAGVPTMAANTTSRVPASRTPPGRFNLTLRTGVIVLLALLLVGGGAWSLGVVFNGKTPWVWLAHEGRETYGTKHNGATLPIANGPESPSQYTLRFAGGDDLVVVPTLTYDGSHPVTIEAWISPESAPERVSSRVWIVAWLGQLQVGHSTESNSLTAQIWDAAGKHQYKQSQPIARGRRFHWASVYTGHSLSVYCNGRRLLLHDPEFDSAKNDVPEIAAPAVAEIGEPLTIGGLHGSASWIPPRYQGSIHALRISRSARYTGDFQPQAQFTKDKQTWALYDFTRGDGPLLRDVSGNQHHGTIDGAKWVPERRIDSAHQDPEREIAEWVLSKRGNLSITTTNGRLLKLKKVSELPSASFTVRHISLDIYQGSNLVSDEEVGRLTTLSNIALLALNGHGLSDSVADVITVLPSLTQVGLYQSRLTDPSLARIVEALPNLVQLNIGATEVSEAGIREIVKLQRLEELFVQGLPLEDDAIVQLTQDVTTLKTLSVEGTKITDAGLTRLAELRPALRRLDVTKTDVTAAGVLMLQKVMPQCNIIWDDETSDK